MKKRKTELDQKDLIFVSSLPLEECMTRLEQLDDRVRFLLRPLSDDEIAFETRPLIVKGSLRRWQGTYTLVECRSDNRLVTLVLPLMMLFIWLFFMGCLIFWPTVAPTIYVASLFFCTAGFIIFVQLYDYSSQAKHFVLHLGDLLESTTLPPYEDYT